MVLDLGGTGLFKGEFLKPSEDDDQVLKAAGKRKIPSNVAGVAGTSSGFPVGALLPWLKSYANTPALEADWVECDGNVINDAESPFNGQNSPNLNGNNNFLRGAAASGGTGGAPSHLHQAINGLNHNVDDTGLDQLQVVSHLPPYYEVVWVMRIK